MGMPSNAPQVGGITPPMQTNTGAFEPDDPIPEREDKSEGRKVPKFVKFFMRKDSDEEGETN
jgi:hypothetical protein